MTQKRTAAIHRETAETKIRLELNLDGTGKSEIRTGVGFLDHMLVLFAKHSQFDLTVDAHGDLEVELRIIPPKMLEFVSAKR